MNNTYMTEAELASILKVSKSTLHKLREEGVIPFQLIGTCIRYCREDIDAWIKGRSFNATSTQIPKTSNAEIATLNNPDQCQKKE